MAENRAIEPPAKRKRIPRVIDNGDVHLIYKIEGKPNEVDVFELGRMLDSIGHVISETNRIIRKPDAGDLAIKVKPFQTGSFIMDFVMHVHQNPQYLFLASQGETIKQVKDALECLGVIKKIKHHGTSLIELVKKLKDGKPAKIEQKGPDNFEYHGADGSVTPVGSQVHTLYNNGTINNYFFPAFGKPLEGDGVEGISTFLKGAQATTGVKLVKDDAASLRAYSEPVDTPIRPEKLENTTVQLLRPKSGNYGEQSGTWTFRVAGTQRNIKATIKHKEFLAQYTSGVIRFYSGDLLKAKVHETQTIDATGEKVTNEIIEVIEYRPGHPSSRGSSS